GFNFLIAASTLSDLIKDAKLELKPSPTSDAWRAGLEHYWADEYSLAITKFEEVETAFPAHSEAPKMIRLSRQAQKDGKEKQPSNSAGVVAAIVAGGIIALGLLAMVVARRRPRPRAPYGAPPGPGQMPMYGRFSPSGPQPMHGAQGSPIPIAKTVA